jgi:hypothetical protein
VPSAEYRESGGCRLEICTVCACLTVDSRFEMSSNSVDPRSPIPRSGERVPLVSARTSCMVWVFFLAPCTGPAAPCHASRIVQGQKSAAPCHAWALALDSRGCGSGAGYSSKAGYSRAAGYTREAGYSWTAGATAAEPATAVKPETASRACTGL